MIRRRQVLEGLRQLSFGEGRAMGAGFGHITLAAIR
jgi:hypothetical protein